MSAMPPLTGLDMAIRLGLGFLAGAIIGFERSSRRQVAGLRTHILISTGAALLMLLSIWLPQELNGMKNGDPGRIAAQVVSGIGFLGAGAIIRLGNNIKGLTTAASLWLIAAVGLALGAGMFLAAGITEAISLLSLSLLERVEKRFFPSERNKLLELSFRESLPDIEKIRKTLRSFSVRVISEDVVQNEGKGKGSKLRLFTGFPDAADPARLARALKTEARVYRVEIKEKY
jgi:putative Mg2+ transporter-C (MgtC) family protein